MGGNRVPRMVPREEPQALKSPETACFLPFLRLGKFSLSMVSVTQHRHLPENSIDLISDQLKLVCVAYKILNKSLSFWEQTIHQKQVCAA